MIHRGNSRGKKIVKECMICGINYTVSGYQSKKYHTCSNYCESILTFLRKKNGVYLQCDYCNKAIYVTLSSLKNKNKHFCSNECNHEYRKYVKPIGSPTSKGLRKKYYGPNWLSQSRKTREQAGYKCTKCGITEKEYKKKMSVHHIKPFVFFDNYEDANRLENLMCVCEDCHRNIHSGENHPSKYNPELMGDNSKKGKTVRNKHYITATKIVDMIKNTDKTLTDIANELNVSLGTVTRIYKGQRWKNLYDEPLYKKYPRSKDEDTIMRIIEDLINTKLTLKNIADKYNVSRSTVQDVYKGYTWKNLYDTPIYLINPRSKSESIRKKKNIY